VRALNSAGLYVNTGGNFNQSDIAITNGTIRNCTENGVVFEGLESERITMSNVITDNCGQEGGTGVRAGIRIGAPSVRINNCIVNNTQKTGGDGAGIIIYNYDTIIDNCTVSNCVTGIRGWDGDGLQNYDATKITNITYLNNTLNVSIMKVNTNFIDTVTTWGRRIFRPIRDLSNAISYQNADGTQTIFNIDTLNGRAGVMTTTPTSRFQVAGAFGFNRTAFNNVNATLNIDHCYVTFSAMTSARTITANRPNKKPRIAHTVVLRLRVFAISAHSQAKRAPKMRIMISSIKFTFYLNKSQ
jgi:hypothetical protein